MPRSAAGKAKRRRKRDDSSSTHEEEEESESEEEEKEEEKRIEDIVRTKFEGDAHRALFHMIGKKRNFVTTGKAKVMKTKTMRISIRVTTARTKKTRTMIPTTKNQKQLRRIRSARILSEDGEDIDDVNKVLEWEPIPDERQKRFDRMGPQDDVSDASSSDAESEEEEEEEEENCVTRRCWNEGDLSRDALKMKTERTR